ncbi:tyrosine phosphatase family protein [Terricaulis sp.]|uniref:tyrosine phosphatase family protein n=1 Tax=Terricaulis sp. TaxID=2768686 RepID=UPI0037845DE5
MNIIVCPLSKAPHMARQHQVARVVSLLDPDSRFPLIDGYGADRHLCVEVHDINQEEEGMDACCDQRMTRILDFVGQWERDAPILIHCYAGISRSTATAFITACAHNPGVDESEIAQALRKASASAFPNRRFVALADAALGRNGRMSRAIASIGDGHNWYDIGEATPFEIPGTFGAAA